jgi:hypothetical protein
MYLSWTKNIKAIEELFIEPEDKSGLGPGSSGTSLASSSPSTTKKKREKPLLDIENITFEFLNIP